MRQQSRAVKSKYRSIKGNGVSEGNGALAAFSPKIPTGRGTKPKIRIGRRATPSGKSRRKAA